MDAVVLINITRRIESEDVGSVSDLTNRDVTPYFLGSSQAGGAPPPPGSEIQKGKVLGPPPPPPPPGSPSSPGEDEEDSEDGEDGEPGSSGSGKGGKDKKPGTPEDSEPADDGGDEPETTSGEDEPATDGETTPGEDETTDGETTPGEDEKGKSGGAPGEDSEPTDGEPGEDGKLGGEPTDGEPGEDGEPTDGEPGEDGEPTDGEPGTPGENKTGESEPSKAEVTHGEGGGSEQINIGDAQKLIDDISSDTEEKVKEGKIDSKSRSSFDSDPDIISNTISQDDKDMVDKIVRDTMSEVNKDPEALGALVQELASSDTANMSNQEVNNLVSKMRNKYPNVKKAFEKFKKLIIGEDTIYRVDKQSKRIEGMWGAEEDVEDVKLENLTYIIDISGSMDTALLSKSIALTSSMIHKEDKSIKPLLIVFGQGAKNLGEVKPIYQDIYSKIRSNHRVGTGGTDFEAAFKLLVKAARTTKGLIILSDFAIPNDDWKYVQELSRGRFRFPVFLICIPGSYESVARLTSHAVFPTKKFFISSVD